MAQKLPWNTVERRNMDDFSGWLWLVVDVLFVAILAGGMIYGTIQWRHRNRSQQMKRASEEAVRRNYREGG
jgi:flagellar biosynthesis/type III secretory pathway M-ring protein FliF/YscJ